MDSDISSKRFSSPSGSPLPRLHLALLLLTPRTTIYPPSILHQGDVLQPFESPQLSTWSDKPSALWLPLWKAVVTTATHAGSCCQDTHNQPWGQRVLNVPPEEQTRLNSAFYPFGIQSRCGSGLCVVCKWGDRTNLYISWISVRKWIMHSCSSTRRPVCPLSALVTSWGNE